MFTAVSPDEPDQPKKSYRSERGTLPAAPPFHHTTTGETDCPILRQIDDALVALRVGRRRAIRILDVGCNDGAWLIHAVRHARMLGFVAIEGRGLDLAHSNIAHARLAAATISDARIGLVFDAAGIADALAEEDDHV